MTKAKHLMVDLETLDLEDSAAIDEIGLCLFTFEEGMLERRLIQVDVMDELLLGATVDPETIHFRRQHARVDREEFDIQSTRDAGLEFILLYREWKPDFIWGNSPAFDLVKLRNMLRRGGHEAPWKHNQEVDHRTLRRVAQWLSIPELDQEMPTHRGDADAHDQALNAHHMFLQMDKMVNPKL